MPTLGFGLRAKSTLALVLACLLALLPAGFVGWQVLDGVKDHFGAAYARNFTQLNRQNILAPVLRDLVLSKRLADSVISREWLLDETNEAKKALFFREAEGYRRDFSDHNYFMISALTRNYYLNGQDKPYTESPQYTLSEAEPNVSVRRSRRFRWARAIPTSGFRPAWG